MDMKKTAAIVVVLAVVLIAALMLAGNKQQANDQNNGNSNQASSQPEQGQMPKFVLGDVTKVEGQKIFISSEGEKTIMAQASTKVIKQVTAKDGSISLAEVQLSDIKAGNKIVAYYDAEPVGTEYQATKIQIIN